MTRRILVTGASIAGTALAWWLDRAGFDVTVVERAPAFREGGQNVDVRGLGREVLRRMGLERAALDAGTGEEGTAWVDAAGRRLATFMADGSGKDGPTAEMEILRGDLACLLRDAIGPSVAFRFGDSVAAIRQDGDTAEVEFESGSRERYDAVLVAEGVGSRTRELVFPGETTPRWMDVTMAFFTIPRASHDDRLWRWYNAPGSRMISLRPDRHGTTRAMLSLQKPPGGEHEWDRARQKAFLRDRFADAGWEAPRVLDGMAEAEDFYFDVLRQPRLDRWSNGRVALVGDAAWCPTPLGGIGASLAIIGSYVMAGELFKGGDVPAAFAAYERVMRPIVEPRQNVPKIGPRLMHPRTRAGIWALHRALGFASRPGIRRIADRLFAGSSDGPELPDYGFGARAAG